MGGVFVICWGVIVSLVRFAAQEVREVRGMDTFRPRERLRQSLGSYLLLGLEFLVAADIINTIAAPTLRQAAVLASIVSIRTFLNYSLSREISRGHCYAKED